MRWKVQSEQRCTRTQSWGWEIPSAGIEDGEAPVEAAAREVEEETGWRPGPMRSLICAEPSSNISDSRHHICRADGATFVGPPTEAWESERVEWIPLSNVRDLIKNRDIVSSTTMTALLYTITEL